MPESASGRFSEEGQRPPVLVLGIGNVLLRDEGVGVRVVEAMADTELPPGVELFDGATAGMDLLEVLAGRRKVVVIDSVEHTSAPGTVLRISPEDLTGTAQVGASLHEIGLLEALTAARQLNIAPQEVVILGVRPKVVEFGIGLSPELTCAVPAVIRWVMDEISSNGQTNPSAAS